MNLVIDAGNTWVKYAFFHEGKPEIIGTLKELSVTCVRNLIRFGSKADAAIISSVGKPAANVISYLSGHGIPCMELNHSTPLPFKNQYSTPQTLGYDRIAAAAGAYTIFPGSNVLIIDAGTAITIDLLTKDGVFLGGNISPGATMRAKAMHAFTKRLPEVAPSKNYGLLGNSTSTALVNGIMNGIVFELEGYISNLMNEYSDLKLILTGGEAPLFDKKLKYPIFVDSDLNLTGLNRILEYNA